MPEPEGGDSPLHSTAGETKKDCNSVAREPHCGGRPERWVYINDDCKQTNRRIDFKTYLLVVYTMPFDNFHPPKFGIAWCQNAGGGENTELQGWGRWLCELLASSCHYFTRSLFMSGCKNWFPESRRVCVSVCFY